MYTLAGMTLDYFFYSYVCRKENDQIIVDRPNRVCIFLSYAVSISRSLPFFIASSDRGSMEGSPLAVEDRPL